MSSKRFPVLIQRGAAMYKYATISWLDNGAGVMIYNEGTSKKLSRHKDGNVYNRIPGTRESSHSTTVPFSDILREQLALVPIPSSFLSNRSTWHRTVPANALVFSSTVLASNGYFVAELVDDTGVSAVLKSYSDHRDFLGAQAVRASAGKTLVVSVLNQRNGDAGSGDASVPMD